MAGILSCIPLHQVQDTQTRITTATSVRISAVPFDLPNVHANDNIYAQSLHTRPAMYRAYMTRDTKGARPLRSRVEVGTQAKFTQSKLTCNIAQVANHKRDTGYCGQLCHLEFHHPPKSLF